MDTATLIRYWILFGVSQAILGAGIMMYYKPAPGMKKKPHPLVPTTLFTIGMTMMLIYGTQDLLLQTIQKVFPS